MNSNNSQSTKLFDSKMVTNSFNVLKSKLNQNHRTILIACMGKMRIGKSTLLNILINIKSGNKASNIIYFKEESSVATVTNGAEFYILSDTNSKTDHVFIDCEGSGNYNSNDMIKLYLMVASISDILVFNVDKAFEDDTLTKFVHQIIVHLEVLKIKVPKIFILIRDAGKSALSNTVKDTTSDLQTLKNKVQTYFHNKFKYNNYLMPVDINFISPPLTDDKGEVSTRNNQSLFYKDIETFSTLLFNNCGLIPHVVDRVSNMEKTVNFLWNYDISKLNQNEMNIFIKQTIDKLTNDNFPSIFNKTNYNGYSNCQSQLEKKRGDLTNMIIKHAKNILLSYDSSMENTIKQTVNVKVDSVKSIMGSAYQTQMTQHAQKREKSKRQVPVYGKKTVQQPYTVTEYYHDGGVLSYCTNCSRLSSTTGCKSNTYHPQACQRRKKRFLGIKIDSWLEHPCCGRRTGSAGCKTDYSHVNSVNQYSCCRRNQGSSGCKSMQKTLYKNVEQDVIVHYNTDYDVGEWIDSYFNYVI